MWTPRIFIGGHEVFAHGTVVGKGKQIVDLYPLPVPNEDYVVRIAFENNETNAQPTVRFVSTNPKLFTVTLINFDTGTITSHLAHIYVANHMHRKVMLSLASSFIGQGETGTRVLHYTFLDGGRA